VDSLDRTASLTRTPPVSLPAPHGPAVEPGPFIKWAGGKSRLLAQYDAHFPDEFGAYHEPFVGGGAVFFYLRPAVATLSDINTTLIETWQAIRDDADAVIDRLEEHRARHDAQHYDRCRRRFNAPRSGSYVERAALFIYLNKTCFNGLYRENRRGEFNVPMGRYDNPALYDRANLLAAAQALQSVELRNEPFDGVLDRAQRGDLVYFDPPYLPMSRTASFTTYAAGGFDIDLQLRLARTFDELARRGCYVMLSNSDVPAAHELYRGWRIETISAPRSINARSDRRGPVSEVLVKNW
jgi:DNA adenine methylase